MFGWKELEARWPAEKVYRVLEILKQNHIRCKMPADDMFFVGPFYMSHPNRRWAIQVRRRDEKRATALLAQEGLMRAAKEPSEGPH